jgi:uncharacterized protein (DUF1330 family)
MAAYLVGHITVRDEALWQRYVGQVGATIAAGGGTLVLRGELAEALAGEAPGRRIVVARFADMAALRAWHDSPAYQALVPLRQAAADVLLAGYRD